MNEVQFFAAQEQAELGNAMLRDLCSVLDIAWPTKKDLAGRGRGRRRIPPTTADRWIVERASRRVYKGTDCGAWLRLNDEGLHVGSIVEGVERTTAVHTLTWREYEKFEGDCSADALAVWLWTKLDEVEAEAKVIWDETHGCQKCGPEDPETGYTPINKKCRSCKGEGTTL